MPTMNGLQALSRRACCSTTALKCSLTQRLASAGAAPHFLRPTRPSVVTLVASAESPASKVEAPAPAFAEDKPRAEATQPAAVAEASSSAQKQPAQERQEGQQRERTSSVRFQTSTEARRPARRDRSEASSQERRVAPRSKPADEQGESQQEARVRDLTVVFTDDVPKLVGKKAGFLQACMSGDKAVILQVAGINGAHGAVQALTRAHEELVASGNLGLEFCVIKGQNIEPFGTTLRLVVRPLKQARTLATDKQMDKPDNNLRVKINDTHLAATARASTIKYINYLSSQQAQQQQQQQAHAQQEAVTDSNETPSSSISPIPFAVFSAVGPVNCQAMLRMAADASAAPKRTLWVVPQSRQVTFVPDVAPAADDEAASSGGSNSGTPVASPAPVTMTGYNLHVYSLRKPAPASSEQQQAPHRQDKLWKTRLAAQQKAQQGSEAAASSMDMPAGGALSSTEEQGDAAAATTVVDAAAAAAAAAAGTTGGADAGSMPSALDWVALNRTLQEVVLQQVELAKILAAQQTQQLQTQQQQQYGGGRGGRGVGRR